METQQGGHDLTLEFNGPFQWCASPPATSLFGAAQAGEHGVYVWTSLTSQGELALYVGQTTRSFFSRMQEHLREQLSGMYSIWDPDSLLQGEVELLWRGMYGRDHEASLENFAIRLPELAQRLTRFIGMIRFYIAPTKEERRVLERAEAAIANGFRSHAAIYEEIFKGIVYRPRRQTEGSLRLRCVWPMPLVGAPDTLEI
jgi:hypothetical protein